MRLTDLDGKEGIVEEIKGPLRKRLRDLGFVEGSKVKIIRTAPFGDPIEIKVKGCMISIRKEDAKEIIVKVL